jgi:hypothetical protein
MQRQERMLFKSNMPQVDRFEMKSTVELSRDSKFEGRHLDMAFVEIQP